MGRLSKRLGKEQGETRETIDDFTFIPPNKPLPTPKHQKEPSVQRKDDNPNTLYNEIVTNPVPHGVFPIKIGEVKDKDGKVLKEGHTLDFSDMEKYTLFYESPRQMRTYMRYQKARLIEDIKGFSGRHAFKFNWKIILIIIGVFVMFIIGFLIITNPDALTNMFQGMFGT